MLSVVASERRAREGESLRVQELCLELQEGCASHELEVESLKMELLSARAKCRQLESTAPNSRIFEKYEADVSRLEAENERLREGLRESCTVQLEVDTCRSTKSSFMVAYPTGRGSVMGGKTAGRGRREEEGEGEENGEVGSLGGGAERINGSQRLWGLEYGQWESKLVTHLRRQLQRALLENSTLSKEVQELRRKERQHQVHKRTAEEAIARANRLQKDLAIRDKQVVVQTVNTRGSIARIEDAQITAKRSQVGEVTARRDCEQLAAMVMELREAYHRLRQQTRRDTLISKLVSGPTPSTCLLLQAPKPLSKWSLVELVHKLQREVTHNPHADSLFERLLRELSIVQLERAEAAVREDRLVQELLAAKEAQQAPPPTRSARFATSKHTR